MNNFSIYISIFFIAYIILYMIMNDLKKFNDKLYNEITNKIWIKTYLIITIGLIHLSWLLLILFLNNKYDETVVGFPSFLLIPYIIYVAIDFKEDNINTIASEKLNNYLNNLVSIYFIFIIIIIIIPNNIKEKLIKNIYNLTHKILHKIL